MDNQSWLTNCNNQLQVMIQQLSKAKNSALGREAIQKARNLEKTFQMVQKEINSIEPIVLDNFSQQFNQLLEFTSNPMNLEKPNKLKGFFITDQLSIKQDEFLNEFQSLIEYSEGIKIQNLTVSFINEFTNDILDGSTPEILVKFNIGAFEFNKEPEYFVSTLIFKQNGDKYIHQFTRSWFQRKSSTLIPEGLNDVILGLIIEIDKNLNQRTLALKLYDSENSFAIPDYSESNVGLLISKDMKIELSPSYNLIIEDLKFDQNTKQQPIMKNQFDHYFSFKLIPSNPKLAYLSQKSQFYNMNQIQIVPTSDQIEKKLGLLEVLDNTLQDRFIIQRKEQDYYISKTPLSDKKQQFFPKVKTKEIKMTSQRNFEIILNDKILITFDPQTNWITAKSN